MAPPRTAVLAAAAAVVAAALAIPGLTMPFLSDDWAQLTSSRAGERLRTPVGDFRPAAMATIALDDLLWSGNPRGFHATNVLLIAAAAALVVLVAARVTGSREVAGLAGLLFAMHPWHVENAAWIAARGDPLYAVPLLGGALAWLRWRDRGRGIPWAALVLFEAALLAKESAVAALAAVAMAVLADPASRRSLGFWARGVVPFAAVALGHAAMRTVALEGPGRIVLGTALSGWPKNLAGMGVAAVLPLDAARIAASPVACGLAATGIVAALALTARLGSGQIPAAAPVGFALFALLAAPHAVGFQERYVFLPVAASSLAIAALVRASGRAYPFAATAMVLVSLAGTGTQWRDWREAARASERFTAELVRVAGTRPGEAIVVANAPFRVRGGSVAGDLSAALEVLEGPPSPVRAAAWISYGEAMPETVVEPARPTGDGKALEIGLRVGDGLFDRVVATGGAGSVASPAPGGIRLTIPRDRDIVVWNLGRLERAYTRTNDRPRRGTREE